MNVRLQDGAVGRVAHIYLDSQHGRLYDLEVRGLIVARGVKEREAPEETEGQPVMPGLFSSKSLEAAQSGVSQVRPGKVMPMRACRCGHPRAVHDLRVSLCDGCIGGHPSFDQGCRQYREERL